MGYGTVVEQFFRSDTPTLALVNLDVYFEYCVYYIIEMVTLLLMISVDIAVLEDCDIFAPQ